jgi:hypothetical protein
LRIAVEQRIQLSRMRVVVASAVFFATLIAGAAGFAMRVGDVEMIREIWSFARWGASAVVVWSCGAQILKLISGIKFDDGHGK